MEQLEQENSARQNGGSSESAVYGLTSFDADSYYQYVYTGLEAQLTEKLKQEQDVPESELKQIYEEKKAQYTYDVGVKALVAEMSAAVGEQKAAEAAAAMQNQKDEKKLAKQFPEINFYTLSMSDLDMQEGKSGAYAARWQTASQMKKGDVSAPFHIGDNLMVIRCLSRTEHGVQRFEDVKNVLKSDVQTQRAQEKIQSQIDGAMLGMNEKELEIVALEELQRK